MRAQFSAWHFIALALLVFPAVAFVAQSPPASAAALVTQPIRVTVDSGGNVTVGTVAGCAATPATLPFDGLAHSISALPNCVITLSAPPDGTNVRYRFGALPYTAVRTCSVALCPAVNRTAYFELKNTFEAVSRAQTTFDGNLTFVVVGAVGRAKTAQVCYVPFVPATTTTSCSGWSDYARNVLLPAHMLHQSPGTRWVINGTRSFVVAKAGGVITGDYYKQVLERTYFSVVSPPGKGYTAPVFSYTALGSSATYGMTARLRLLWVDFNSTWSVTNPLVGSGSSVRWYSNSPTGGKALQSGLIRPVYFQQFNESIGFSVVGASHPSPPTVTFRQFRIAVTVTAQHAGLTDWVNAGTRVVYVKTLLGSNATERWSTPSASFGSTLGGSFDPLYFQQYYTNFAYTTSDSSVIPVGTVVGSVYQYGTLTGHRLLSDGAGGVTPSSAWVDNGSASLRFLTASNGTQRWALQAIADVRAVTSSGLVTESGYFHQFALTLSYQVVGGGSPPSPTFSCTEFGSSVVVSLTHSGVTYWCDKGSNWSVSPGLLSGSGVSVRWITTQLLNGLALSPTAQTFTYYHQFLVTFTRSIIGGGSPSDPAVEFTQFGSTNSTTATSAGVDVWVDALTPYTYADPTPGSTGSERWAAAVAPTGTVSAAGTVDPSFYHQYSIVLQYTLSGTGSPAAPNVNYTSFGVSNLKQASLGLTSTAWIDAGTTATYPATITDGVTTWTTSTTTFVASSSTIFDPTYA